MDSYPFSRALVSLKLTGRLLCRKIRVCRLCAHRFYDGYLERLPTRAENIKELRQREYDVLVIGGGATGAGCALDATSRGLITALVEADDFASGTSSKSTKLIHGGVRYLQLAFDNFNFGQLKLVREALRERAIMLSIAPYMNRPLPIMIPIYRLWEVPYVWAGLKLYDLLSLGKRVGASHYVSRDKVLAEFPLLEADGLRGAVVYYDGQFDDARFCVSLILTATYCGANVANYMDVLAINEQDGLFRSVYVHDRLSGEHFLIHTRCVINATGPFADQVRRMVEPGVVPITQPSCGAHIVLPECYCSRKYGLLNPKTADGRVVFMLPWQGHTIAGTTDGLCRLTNEPAPTHAEVDFILDSLRSLMVPNMPVDRAQVLSAWSGIRPLVADPDASSSKSLVRSHLVAVSDQTVVTVAGGKWTSYRRMAEEAVDAAIECAELQPLWSCYTNRLPIVGTVDYTSDIPCDLERDFNLSPDVAQHLAKTYGSNSYALMGKMPPHMRERIHPDFPYIEAEVFYACTQEYACTVIDVLARRMRIAFVDARAAFDMMPTVTCIMSNVLQWSNDERQHQMRYAKHFLRRQMSLDDIVKRQNILDNERLTKMSGNESV